MSRVRSMTGRTRLAFVAVALLGALLAGIQFVLVLQTWSGPVANGYYWRLAALFQGIAGIVYTTVGLVIARRRPQIVVGWLVATIGLGILTYQSISEYALRALLVESVPLAGANEAALLSQTTWSLAFGPIAILLLLYPTGRLVSRGWMWAGVAAALAMVTIAGIGTLVLWPYRQAGAELLNLDDSLINDRVAPMFNVGLILLFGGAGRLLCFVDRSLTS